jgi:hypothetical protein
MIFNGFNTALLIIATSHLAGAVEVQLKNSDSDSWLPAWIEPSYIYIIISAISAISVISAFVLYKICYKDSNKQMQMKKVTFADSKVIIEVYSDQKEEPVTSEFAQGKGTGQPNDSKVNEMIINGARISKKTRNVEESEESEESDKVFQEFFFNQRFERLNQNQQVAVMKALGHQEIPDNITALFEGTVTSKIKGNLADEVENALATAEGRNPASM